MVASTLSVKRSLSSVSGYLLQRISSSSSQFWASCCEDVVVLSAASLMRLMSLDVRGLRSGRLVEASEAIDQLAEETTRVIVKMKK